MNIMVKPRPEVLADFSMFCTVLDEKSERHPYDIDNLLAAGLVEAVPGRSIYRLTATGEALRAAREE
ncbi:MAG TPA: hypothetical protein VJ698_19225 [Noviherbaspirillum sp.]|uniref:hypothetical protein n=1 Tax=Noviherbaspirillum sp. TaxID=1926288 RepID=UPI002B498ED2|nr:hypothetical protein [Noviherbaspirillum sp.]HJV87609.1 hypothetical protein [Noviherbaspirillum sp.]